MNYWWVNHKQTHTEEIEGGYIWSPKNERNGANSEFYNNLTRTAPGDIVFSYADAKIKAIGVVTHPHSEEPKPVVFGNTGSNWASTGWIVPIEWRLLQNAFSPKAYIEEIAPLLPNGYSPITPQGNGNQKCYLASISPELAIKLLTIADDPTIFEEISAVQGDVEIDAEVEAVLNARIDPTEKEQIIKARLGQGLFRQRLVKIEGRCRLTGIRELQFLVASHIKPWKYSNNDERVDGNNGLLLSPHIDRLFDKGWISFSEDGALLVSNERAKNALTAWGIDTNINIGRFNRLQATYMEYNRNNVFKPPED